MSRQALPSLTNAMEFTEITEEVEDNLVPETTSGDQCEECGAPVDHLQRYCVNCGARRLAVADPAATYLAQASARARMRTRPASAGTRTGASSRGPVNGTIALLALIAILVAIGVGVLIGHDTASSGGGPKSPSVSTTSTAGKQGKSGTSAVDNATGKSYLKKALSGPSSVSVP